MDRLPGYLLRNKGGNISIPPPILCHPRTLSMSSTFGDALLTLVLAPSKRSNALQIVPGGAYPPFFFLPFLPTSPAVHH